MAQLAHTIRRSARARRVRVTVDAQRGVEVVLPARAPRRAAEEALVALRPWIERRLARIEAARPRRDGWLPYLDERLALHEQAGRTRVARRGQELLVPAGHSDEAIERWYRRAARAEIGERLERAAAGRTWGPLSIRSQRTRWASCSASGAMSFNWRLLLAPERVLDYVVWHEVCHLDVRDHSPRFWKLVEARCPDWREPAAWLRANGSGLVL